MPNPGQRGPSNPAPVNGALHANPRETAMTARNANPSATSGTSGETVTVSSTTVRCDGGGGALGHPAVYLEIGAAGDITCPYCSRRFQLDKNAPAQSAH